MEDEDPVTKFVQIQMDLSFAVASLAFLNQDTVAVVGIIKIISKGISLSSV